MRNFKLLLVWIISGGALLSCDLPSTPKDPNFSFSHKVEAPLLFEKTFQFLGGGGEIEALIDTTGEEFDSLFVVTEGGDDDGLITLSREEEFDFGDLNEAIPEISADPAAFSSQVGEIELGSFSSTEGNLGEASFADLTGLDPNLISPGDPVPPQAISPEVTIDLETDFFESATIKDGSLQIRLENNVGFNLDDISVTLISDPDTTFNGDEEDVVTSGTGTINDGEQATIDLPFDEGDVLANPQVRVSITWTSSLNPLDPNQQTFQRAPESLVVISAGGVDLVASAVKAAVTAQDFSTSSTTAFDATEFQFTQPDHFVELESGTITIAPIQNGLDLTVETLVISFPTILAPPAIEGDPYNPADSLVISYTGANRILRSSSSIEQVIPLDGYRISALNNEITYNIVALTENTQEAPVGDQTRVISETDQISSSVEITNLRIARAEGIIQSQTVLLGDDDPLNGEDIIDLFNETEVSLTEIEGIESLSEEIDGIEFAGASLTINYTSNIGIPTTIYAAILGVTGDGEEIFLVGEPGTDREVPPGAPITGILANGMQLTENQMIRFDLEVSPDGSIINGFSTFDEDNSTVIDFLNELPTEIRFAGRAVINESNGEATIATPLEFDPGILVDLPIYFSADNASYDFKQDGSSVSDLPVVFEDDNETEGQLIVNYDNGLPFGFDLEIQFLDTTGSVLTTVPLPTDLAVELGAADVDADSRFVSSINSDQLIISLSNTQIKNMSETDSIAVSAKLNTFNTEAVKVRDTDSITISASINITVQTKVGDN